jgi:hypothetical protein
MRRSPSDGRVARSQLHTSLPDREFLARPERYLSNACYASGRSSDRVKLHATYVMQMTASDWLERAVALLLPHL